MKFLGWRVNDIKKTNSTTTIYFCKSTVSFMIKSYNMGDGTSQYDLDLTWTSSVPAPYYCAY